MSSSLDKNLNECLDDQDYIIMDELKMMQKISNAAGCRWVFQQAPKYDYDLMVYRWGDDPETIEEDRELVGYIELERAEEDGWNQGGFPDDWDRLCFLRRKINKFFGTNQWGNQPKNDLPTLYLKFSHQMDGCFMAPVPVVDALGTETPRSDGTRDNTYLQLDRGDPYIYFSLEYCVDFMKKYFTSEDCRSRIDNTV